MAQHSSIHLLAKRLQHGSAAEQKEAACSLAEPLGGQQPCDLPSDGGAGAVEALVHCMRADCSPDGSAFHLQHAQR